MKGTGKDLFEKHFFKFGLFIFCFLYSPILLASSNSFNGAFIESSESKAFICKMPFGCVRFEDDRIVYQFLNVTEVEKDPLLGDRISIPAKAEVHNIVIKFRNSKVKFPTGEVSSGSKTNYLLGSNPQFWKTDLENYKKLVYKNIYDGIDLEYYFVNGQLKYDFIVNPGANPSDIQMELLGAIDYELNGTKEISLINSMGSISDYIPESYQYLQEKKSLVDVEFLLENSLLRFNVKAYNSNEVLVIDPSLKFSTFLGGSGNDYQYTGGLSRDNAGNIYETGRTLSMNFPTTPGVVQLVNGGNLDAVVFKFNSTGTSLLYSTYIGGNDVDAGYTTIVDKVTSEVYVGGTTSSANFPTTAGAYQTVYGGSLYDPFVFKLNSNGNGFVYSTFLGNGFQDLCASITVDAIGQVWVVGQSTGNYLTTPGAYQSVYGGGPWDVFVAKLNATGSSLLYATLYGGAGDDHSHSIQLESTGNIAIMGFSSGGLPVTAGAYDVSYNGGVYDIYIARFNSVLTSLNNSTYIGGSGTDWSWNSFVLDASDNAIVTGYTNSNNFPLTIGAFQSSYGGGANDGLLFKMSSNGSALINSTYFGSGGDDQGWGVALNSLEEPIIVGQFGVSLPFTFCTYDSTANGSDDAFVTHFSQSYNSLIYSSYVGSTNSDVGVNVILNGNNYIVAGFTYSNGFPTIPGSYDVSLNGGQDFFLFEMDPSIVANVSASFISVDSICLGQTINFNNTSVGTNSFIWNFDDGNTSSLISPSHTFINSGDYNVSLVAVNTTCGINDTTFFNVHVEVMPDANFTFTVSCTGQVQFNSIPSSSNYNWNFGDGTNSNQANPLHQYNMSLIPYNASLIVSNPGGCADTALSLINVPFMPIADFLIPDTICGLTLYFQNMSSNSSLYQWEFGDGNSSTILSPTHTFATQGVYFIKLVANNGLCTDSIIKKLTVIDMPIASFSYNTSCNLGVSIINSSLFSTGYSWDMGDGIQLNNIPVVYTYLKDSLYDVELIATNQNYCYDTISAQIQIVQTPSVDIIVDSTSCTKSISFNSSGMASNYYWDFGDGWNSIAKNPMHIYLNSGNYDVYLYSSNGSCIDTSYKSITIFDLPDATFMLFENCNDTIQLIHSINNNYQYSWSFGDGSFANSQSPSHVYLAQGKYEIGLTVIDSNNCVDSTKLEVYVIFDEDFEVSYFLDSCAYTYYFNVSDSLNSIFCDFGDGQYAVDSIFKHQYQFSGLKRVLFIHRYQTVCADTVEIDLDVPFDLNQQLYIPNSFTPNHDGKNDFFEIPYVINCVDFKISIYNKWGQRIFESTEIDFKWDGKYHGEKSPEGLYVYKIERKTNKESDKIGFVFLVR
jgi:gliding motility-associated-like protein